MQPPAARDVPLLVVDEPPVLLEPAKVRVGDRVRVRGGLLVLKARVRLDKRVETVARGMPPGDPSYSDYLLLVRSIKVLEK